MGGFAFYRKLEYQFPIKEPPRWADQIDRWYQLDAHAYGLTEAYFALKRPDETPPDFILLASAAGSNETDFHFAQNGAISPSKFVHTLPNIRGSTLCQSMQWKGPLLCVQHGPSTQLTALSEAMELLSESRKKIWIWSISDNYCVHWFSLQLKREIFSPPLEYPEGHAKGVGGFFRIEKDTKSVFHGKILSSDDTFQQWLRKKSVDAFSLPGRYVMRRLTQAE